MTLFIFVGEASPDPLVVDYGIIRIAPIELNVAGIGDLLSIHTASFGWENAQKHGTPNVHFLPMLQPKLDPPSPR